jgi:hypothetical protein
MMQPSNIYITASANANGRETKSSLDQVFAFKFGRFW